MIEQAVIMNVCCCCMVRPPEDSCLSSTMASANRSSRHNLRLYYNYHSISFNRDMKIFPGKVELTGYSNTRLSLGKVELIGDRQSYETTGNTW